MTQNKYKYVAEDKTLEIYDNFEDLVSDCIVMKDVDTLIFDSLSKFNGLIVLTLGYKFNRPIMLTKQVRCLKNFSINPLF